MRMKITRISLLARPNKRKVTPKYTGPPPVHWKSVKRPLTPEKNKRLEMLSEPNPIRASKKYIPQEESPTNVTKSALEAACTPRLDHLSRPFVRTLVATKKLGMCLGQSFIDTMNERIAMSLDTIYYHNKKSMMSKEAEKKQSAKSLQAKKKKQWEPDPEKLNVLAKPKPIHRPPPLPRRIHHPIEFFEERAKLLSTPRHIYKSPSKDSMVKKLIVPRSALEYEATERIIELAKVPEFRMKKPSIIMGISPGALKYVATESIKQLAVPRPRANAPEMDLKENPYDISPAALKYKATPRIIELAKPIER